MSSTELYESLITELSELDRAALIERLAHFTGDLHLDFTPDFLTHCDTDKLRHLLLAAEWRSRGKTISQ